MSLVFLPSLILMPLAFACATSHGSKDLECTTALLPGAIDAAGRTALACDKIIQNVRSFVQCRWVTEVLCQQGVNVVRRG